MNEQSIGFTPNQTVRTSRANLGERDTPHFLICVRWSGNGDRDVEVCSGEAQAGDEAGTRIKDEAARLRMTLPLAVAPPAHREDMRWNPNDDGINFNP